MLSPLGPAEQLLGGSRDISANSFWMRFAADERPAPFDLDDIYNAADSRSKIWSRLKANLSRQEGGLQTWERECLTRHAQLSAGITIQCL